MRCFAPIVIVALVAAGTVRPAYAARSPSQPTSISVSTDTARAAAPRRGLVGRTALSERRTDGDEVFIVPCTVELVAIPTLSLIPVAEISLPSFEPVSIDEVARGPPSLVVPHPSS
jgi:hypothetical protein